MNTRNLHHGHRPKNKPSPTYHSYTAMKARCNNPNTINFHLYGDRGITICKEWQKSFEAFLKDMGERPEGMTLDRINNDGPYEPSNCQWTTRKKQASNRRNGWIKRHENQTRNNVWS